MSLNLSKTAIAQKLRIKMKKVKTKNKKRTVELSQQNISYLQKELGTSKQETIKSLLQVRSGLIESINRSTANEFKMSRPEMESQQNQPMPTSILQNQKSTK